MVRFSKYLTFKDEKRKLNKNTSLRPLDQFEVGYITTSLVQTRELEAVNAV